MIIAIHDQNVTLQGVTYEVAHGVFVELDSGSIDDAIYQYTAYKSIELKNEIISQIQTRLDSFAKERGYEGILSACTYATSLVTKFKNEGKTCVNLRDSTWAAAYAILAQVEEGTRPMPSSIADIEADLPALVWAS